MSEVTGNRQGASQFNRDVVVVGGCGHVGLPLAVAFASRGQEVGIYDLNAHSVDLVNRGEMPFLEEGVGDVLAAHIGKNLTASTDPSIISGARFVVVVIGTPVDEHLNPDPNAVLAAIEDFVPFLSKGQTLVLRSTLYPGTTRMVERQIAERGIDVDVSFCPERIAEGKAMVELFDLPQIVSGRNDEVIEKASSLFLTITERVVPMAPEEAELAKLFTNAWRYIKFATANQLFMMATDFGVDYDKIRRGLSIDYPRAADLPGAGFAAGPCLLKDTMQLAAFSNNNFVLGHSAMLVNEGLPLYLVSQIEQRCDLNSLTVGILGMAFKGESDDIRSSLSYKLKRILKFRSAGVLCTDPYVHDDSTLVDLNTVLANADLLIIAAPHNEYQDLKIDRPVINVWSSESTGLL